MAIAAVLATVLVAQNARATSYASNLTNNNGTVSFRLNEAADNVKVIGNAGTLTNDLGAIARGLTVTNLTSAGLTGGVFNVMVTKVGSGTPGTNGLPSVSFANTRGITVNVNPASPYFGRVYVANTTTNNNGKGDGLFIFGSDLSDTFGQGNVPRTGGITNFIVGGTSSPYRIKVGHDDDMLYVCDWSDASGNLYVVDPDITSSASTRYVLKQIVGTASIPVGSNNVHGSVAAVEVTGSLAAGNLKVFTIDEDYQTDPSIPLSGGQGYEENSLWEYDIGSGPLPWSNAPNAKLLTPTINFVSQTMNLGRGTNGYFYVANNRSSGNEAGIFVVDSSGNLLFNSRTESIAEGFTADVLKDICAAAVSQDGKYLATLGFGGSSGNANVVTIVPLTNGIPNLPARFQFTGFATTASGRDMAFDAADNLYIASSGLGIVQALSLGITATNTTGSDGTFVSAVPATQVSATLLDPNTSVTNTLFEADPTTVATINLVRTNDDFGGPLTVNFTLTGTATRGTQVSGDYYIATNGVVITNATAVTIPAGTSNVLLTVVPNSDTIPELTETVIFGLGGGPYTAVSPSSATIAIVDNSTNMVDISAVVFNQMYEGNTNDFVRFRLQRRGDTNAPSYDVNINYAGTATSGSDYAPVATVTIDPGVVTKTFDVFVLQDSLIENTETVIAKVAAGSSYLVGTNNALTTNAVASIIDDDVPAETVLFLDDFTTDTSANWTQFFASYPDDTNYDATVQFAYDYSQLGIPPAPHSTNGDTLGLMMTVNKNDASASAAGLNLYPIGQTFSNNYVLRFDMYLMQNGSAATTEYATFGMNHSGTQTNWFRNSGTGIAPGWTGDGIWAYVEADGAALGDYILNSGTVVTNGGVIDPVTVASRNASTLTQQFHQPPWTSGSGSGAPGNTPSTTTPSWAEVELSQINNVITLRINNTVIFAYTNTTAFTNGNIMLGYDDAFDSIGSGGGGLVVYDNVRVVTVNPPSIAVQPTNVIAGVGTNVSFAVTVNPTATGITNYQWLINGNPMSGATTNPLSFGVLPTSFSNYSVVVSDGYYTNTSTTATLRPPPPVFITQPVSRAAAFGANATFTSLARTFSGTTNYQWQFNSANIAGRTTANLTVTNVQNANAGAYRVVVGDGGYNTAITSTAAQLTIAASPNVTNTLTGTSFKLTFPTEVGPNYIVEYKTNLTDAAWIPLSTNAGNGSAVNVTDSISSAASRFYRVRIQ
jgi:parallel beta-helix repeat protein